MEGRDYLVSGLTIIRSLKVHDPMLYSPYHKRPCVPSKWNGPNTR